MNQRLVSLDAFRGFTIAAMLLVNNPGDWNHLYAPLAHAKWDGWTLTDCIFPFFVFISGVSMQISLGRRAALGVDRGQLLAQITRRGLTIVAIGLVLNLIPTFDLATVRIPGVLQRLGLCTILAAPLVLFGNWRVQLAWCIGLLLVYTTIMHTVPVPDAQGVWHTASWQPGEDVGAWLDRTLMPGHLWRASKTWDPEGLLSTLPAVASQLAGVLVGQWLSAKREAMEKTAWLMVAGVLLLCSGQILGAWSLPINKALWTPAYVLLMAGWSCLGLGVFYWLADAQPHPRLRERMQHGLQPLVIFGMNALFLFVLSGLVAKLLLFWKVAPNVALKAAIYASMQDWGMSAVNTSLAFALCFVASMYGVAWWMWRNNWFVKV